MRATLRDALLLIARALREDSARAARSGGPGRAASAAHLMLLLAGVPVHVVAERLGHADPAVTLRVYAHVIRQHAAGVADIFARHVDDPPEDVGAAG
ncbi:MAG TPA: hypothetical protein VF053_10560 [Streptosporangiales bacterium]